MGFIKRLLGLEVKPGEPMNTSDEDFEREVLNSELPCFVDFYNLWCASCQVMAGLLNEIGPDYIDRAKFFKLNVDKNPATPAQFSISSVPTLIVFKNGEPVNRLVGLFPLQPLREWIDRNI